MNLNPIPDFLADACLITGDRWDFLPSRDLVEAARVWSLDHCKPDLGLRALSLRLADAAEAVQADGKAYSRRRTALAMGYCGIRLREPMARRLAAVRAAGGESPCAPPP